MVEGVGLGRIVHFVKSNGEELAAIIVKVLDKETGNVNLQVFSSDNEKILCNIYACNVFFQMGIIYSEKPTLQTWHWPERE